jgi:hypothetical protein
MFHFSVFRFTDYVFIRRRHRITGAGFPHSEISRIKACVPLPEAYRSLLRPSSPDEAKAFTNCCNWFMQTLYILGVYLTHLHFDDLLFYPKLSKNKIVVFELYIAFKAHPSANPGFAGEANGGPRWT